MQTRKLFAILTLIIILSMTALVWFFPPTGDFGAENPFWNGLTTFNAQLNASPIETFDNLPANPRATTLITVPYTQFTSTELEKVHSYVTQGGTLIVLDDYGYGNQILSHLNLNVKFSNSPLIDPLFNYKSKELPKITNFEETTLTRNLSSIVFNYATILTGTSETTVIAYSSKFSVLDQNGNAVWEETEPAGPFPVAAYKKIGEGYLVAVADPSILINSMINMDNNLDFLNNIATLQSSNPQILVDQIHLPKTPLDEAKMAIATGYGAVSSPAGTLSLIVLVLALSLKSMWHKGGKLGTETN